MLEVNRLRLQVRHNSLVTNVASAIAILVGSLVLLGWWLDIEVIKRGFLNFPATIKPNTALCFVLTGVSLCLLTLSKVRVDSRNLETQPRKKLKKNYLWVSEVCAVTVILIATLTLSQYIFGWNLGIDQLLVDNLSTPVTTYQARMAWNTALNFLLIGTALEVLIHRQNKRSYWYAQLLTLIAAVIALQVVLCYVYRVKSFSSLTIYQITCTSLYTAILFIVLCMGILWGWAEQGLMKIATSDTYGGKIFRQFLGYAIAVPLVLGWLIVEGQRTGQYSPSFAVAIFAVILMVMFAIVIWQSAIIIERLSQQGDRAQATVKAYEAKLRSFVDANIIGITFGDIDGGIHQANQAFLAMVGYTPEDLLAGRVRWDNITPPEYLPLDEQHIAEAQANPQGACTPYEKEYIHQDGSRIPVLVGYVLMGEQKQETVAFIINLQESKQAQAKILKLNKDLQRRIVELQTLLEVIPIGIGIAEDPQCQSINVNPAFAKQLGISLQTNASLTAPLAEKPTQFQVYRQGKELLPEELPMQYAATHGVEVLDFEVDVVHENGEIIKLLEYVAPLFDEEGKTRGCIGAFLDITERKQAEEQLRNQQQWLEEVLNFMPIPLLLIEPGTARVTFANRAADELAGGEFPKGIPAAEYHTAYYCTDADGNLIPNEQMPGVRVARGERLHGFEMDWHTKNGIRSLLIFADTLPAIHGYPATCIVVFQEISNLKQAEKARLLNYQRLQLLFSTASDLLSSQEPLVLIDSCFDKLAQQIELDVYINYLVEPENSQVMRLAAYRGLSPEIATQLECLPLGQAVCGIVAQQRQPICVESVQESNDSTTELLRSLGLTAYYCYPLTAQGKVLGTLSFGSRTRTVFTENQKGMMQAVCDQIAIAMERAQLIASLQQQTEQLTQANRMKDEFLAILSHELRSPLNAILGWAQLLQSRQLNETQTAKGLETIERNAKAQTQLIEDLLDISRMIRGKLRLNVCNCNLVSIIHAAIENINLAAKAKEIDVQLSLSPQLESLHPENNQFLVSGDPERLQQIIWNLLTNAIKFTPRGGKVEIRLAQISESAATPNYDYAQIQVIDTGIGINPSFLPYVFDRFRQADSSSTRSHGGLGLGLAIVRHLVELHGGTIHVDSLGEGQGATFTVKLPLLACCHVAIAPATTTAENVTPSPEYPHC